MIELGLSKIRPEKRESGGSFSDAVVRLLESQAAGTAASTGSTAAVEAASGSLSRAFASAEVSGPPWAKRAISAGFLAQVGRDLVRRGESMHVLEVNGAGRVSLLPAASWHFEGRRASKHLARSGHRLRAKHVHNPKPALLGRDLLPVGQQSRPALHGHRAAFVGAHNGAAPE